MPETLSERLRSNAQLPVCPYDQRSPDYWTAPNDKPCVICGTLNDPAAPNLCCGADTRLFIEAADAIERMQKRIEFLEGTLQPFSDAAADTEGYSDDVAVGCDPAMELAVEIGEGAFGPLKVAHLRRARAALSSPQPASAMPQDECGR